MIRTLYVDLLNLLNLPIFILQEKTRDRKDNDKKLNHTFDWQKLI